MAKADLTAAQLRERLEYAPETGVFRWKKVFGARRAGTVAGSISTGGYWRLLIRPHGAFSAHRLAWLYVHGEWPTHQIDHINGNRLDNRIANLRDIPQSGNVQNRRRANADSTTGVLGVSPSRGRFGARIRLNNRLIWLGTYDTPGEAHAAYVSAKRKLH